MTGLDLGHLHLESPLLVLLVELGRQVLLQLLHVLLRLAGQRLGDLPLCEALPEIGRQVLLLHRLWGEGIDRKQFIR